MFETGPYAGLSVFASCQLAAWMWRQQYPMLGYMPSAAAAQPAACTPEQLQNHPATSVMVGEQTVNGTRHFSVTIISPLPVVLTKVQSSQVHLPTFLYLLLTRTCHRVY